MSARETVRAVPMCLLGGLAAALVVTLILVFALAAAVLVWDLGGEVITPVNQVIKVVSILCGTLVAAKGMKGWQAGLCMGALYMALGIVLYCAFAGQMLPLIVIVGDMALGCVAGFLSGMLAGTMKR